MQFVRTTAVGLACIALACTTALAAANLAASPDVTRGSYASWNAGANRVQVDPKLVLRYGGGKYRAVSGFNPVPPI